MKPRCFNCKHALKIDKIGKLNRGCTFGDSENNLKSHLQTCEHHEFSESAKNRMFWMDKLSKNKPRTKIEYGKAKCCVMVVNKENVVTRTPTVIWEYQYSDRNDVKIEYNYDCEPNTIKNETFELISKKEFDSIINDIKKRNAINFTIKLR